MTKTEMCKHSNQKRTHYWAIIWPLFMIVTSPRCVMWRRDNLMITRKIAEWHFSSHYHRPDLTSAKRRAHSVLNNGAVTEPESSSYLRVIFPFRAHQVWTFWSKRMKWEWIIWWVNHLSIYQLFSAVFHLTFAAIYSPLGDWAIVMAEPVSVTMEHTSVIFLLLLSNCCGKRLRHVWWRCHQSSVVDSLECAPDSEIDIELQESPSLVSMNPFTNPICSKKSIHEYILC